jgi:two-component system cell cycle response regulator DivK
MSKILIVDDNESNIKFLRIILSKTGYNVLEAKNGKTAIEIAIKENPELILMDIMMPELDGFEALKILKNMDNLKNIPVIAITALAMKGDKEKILDAGFIDYISKPIDYKELLKKINRFI